MAVTGRINQCNRSVFISVSQECCGNGFLATASWQRFLISPKSALPSYYQSQYYPHITKVSITLILSKSALPSYYQSQYYPHITKVSITLILSKSVLPSYYQSQHYPHHPQTLCQVAPPDVQFSSIWYQYARKSPYALHPFSQRFLQRCLGNSCPVGVTADGPLSCSPGRSSSAVVCQTWDHHSPWWLGSRRLFDVINCYRDVILHL